MQLQPIMGLLSEDVITLDEPCEPMKDLVIILSAGKATRFFDFAKSYAKSTLPYNGVPIISHTVDMVVKNIPNSEIWITVPENKEIADSVENALTITHNEEFFKEHSVTFIRQEPKGPGFSIADVISVQNSNGREFKSVYVILGDIIVNSFGSMIIPHRYNGDIFSFSTNTVSDWSRWCLYNKKTEEFIDKPKNDVGVTDALSGVYRFSSYDRLKNAVTLYLSDDRSRDDTEIQILDIINSYIDVDDVILDQVNNVSITDFGDISDWKMNNDVTKCRSFNSIIDLDNEILKSSNDIEKMYQEYNWLRHMNEIPKYSKYVPRVFSIKNDMHQAEYSMEKINLPTLRDMFLFFDRSKETWDKVLDNVFFMLNEFGVYNTKSSEDFKNVVLNKTYERVSKLPLQMQDHIVILDFLEDFKYEMKTMKVTSSVIHGDLCFSNMFYDGSNIKLIDPNGRFYGFREYDLAKMMHSVVYMYDFVDSSLFLNHGNSINHYTKKCHEIGDLFIDKLEKKGYNTNNIRLLTASLFLSMIPLHSHSEENQIVYFEIFKKVYAEWKAKS